MQAKASNPELQHLSTGAFLTRILKEYGFSGLFQGACAVLRRAHDHLQRLRCEVSTHDA